MDTEAVLAWVDQLALVKTGQRLSDLQRTILQKVWQGDRYFEIAAHYGCTEGHVKDVGADLWHFLSKELGEKITKTNCRRALLEGLARAKSKWQEAEPSTRPPQSDASAEKPELSETQLSPSALFVSPSDLASSSDPVSSSDSPNFLGRASAIAHLNLLTNQGAKVTVIQGEGGLGKTTLAQQYLLSEGFEVVLELLMAKETQNLVSAERVVEEWLKQDFGVAPGTEVGVSLSRLKRQLQGRRVGVLIDNLETALDIHGRFIESQRSYVELLRVLADAGIQTVTLITSRDRLCESSLNVTHYRLPGLDLEAWQAFFEKRAVAIDRPTLQNMHRAYGGNAKAMGLLHGIIQEDFAGDMAAYWQENQADLLVHADLKDLVVSQVNRLQVLDPQAYSLFCRLGCYRYQDVPTIPTQGLMSLMWDVPPVQHREAIASLRNRSLVECRNGEYWLHPVIRAEAIARLRSSDEWETINRKAAEFWMERVQTIETVRDALQALEAYYHYVEIRDFEWAGKVILKSRNNQWKQYLPLGSTLYRMGLLQPVVDAITRVIENVQSDQNRSELYNILGDVYWITGKIHEAIACQEKSIALATQALRGVPSTLKHKHTIYCLKMLEVDALLSKGLYNIDLWELEEAKQLFEQVIAIARNTDHHRWAQKATVCLALVNSCIGFQKEAHQLAQSVIVEQLIKQAEQFAYFMQILGQTYINLAKFGQANSVFQKTLEFAEAGHYTQIKARTLVGLAAINRLRSKPDDALELHTKAINLLDKIGAKCDLAEALFQRGLTYQTLEHLHQSKLDFNQAMQLFSEIQAPRQVQKVIQVMKS